ncbi:hypothetical protein Hanom_Chr02g00155921 [Helianthus anomalus]
MKPIWLKDRTQVSLGLLSLPTSAPLCTKWKLNPHLLREMQVFHHLIFVPVVISLKKVEYLISYRFHSNIHSIED